MHTNSNEIPTGDNENYTIRAQEEKSTEWGIDSCLLVENTKVGACLTLWHGLSLQHHVVSMYAQATPQKGR